MRFENIYREIVKHCPVTAKSLLSHATMIERTYINGKSTYIINGKKVSLYHYKIQDNASLFLDIYERYNEY